VLEAALVPDRLVLIYDCVKKSEPVPRQRVLASGEPSIHWIGV
jgi:hypothetical protein